MGFADLHIHSIHSYDGICTVPAILKHVADATNLNVIALTDHDTMDGIPEALALAPRYGLQVVPGCEVSTAEGHLLALFIDRPVQRGLSLVETLQKVGRMGGIGVAPHPLAWGASSLTFESIWKALQDPEASRALVGIEAYNGGLVDTRQNRIVYKAAESLPLAQVGDSDAHTLAVIGQGSTIFEGRSATDLRAGLLARKTQVMMRNGLNGTQILLDYVYRFLLRKLGWVVWNSSPRYPLSYERLSYAMGLSQRFKAKGATTPR